MALLSDSNPFLGLRFQSHTWSAMLLTKVISVIKRFNSI